MMADAEGAYLDYNVIEAFGKVLEPCPHRYYDLESWILDGPACADLYRDPIISEQIYETSWNTYGTGGELS